MFTGLVLGMGEILSISQSGAQARLSIRPQFNIANIVQGESIAINGACLSVESFENNDFSVYASAETMNLTNLCFLKKNSIVNLERALSVGSRLGGHMVSGHVDGLGIISEIKQAGQSKQVQITYPAHFKNQLISKGSVALDGISLTINLCTDTFFEVNIIPETQKSTTVQFWQKGQKLNLETDIIGKYVEKMLAGYLIKNQQESNITFDFLRENGF